MSEIPLGRSTGYPTAYAPELLFSIPRNENRKRLGIDEHSLPFRGYDLWRAYEVSCLDGRGKPLVAMGEFIVPANSPNIIESKSLKLYLNSLNQASFQGLDSLQARIGEDLSSAAGSPVIVQLYALRQPDGFSLEGPTGFCLDDLPIEVDIYKPEPMLLHTDAQQNVDETVYSDLFKSNCPVTGQPDWGTVVIQYQGAAIDHESLLRYLVSFRDHEGFHEDCTEQIFQDLLQCCKPANLSVMIHFLRRGGLEINPVRSMAPVQVDFPANRFVRQ